MSIKESLTECPKTSSKELKSIDLVRKFLLPKIGNIFDLDFLR
jgi:hypothetical protein